MEVDRMAVFTRNHRVHLEWAATAAKRDPESLATFKSARPWVAAAKHIMRHGSCLAYFGVTDEGPVIKYIGAIVDIEVTDEYDPLNTKSRRVQNLLLHTTEEERAFGLSVMGKQAKTLYVVKGCREIEPFPQNALLKAKNLQPLDSGFTRGYSLVRARGRDAGAAGGSV